MASAADRATTLTTLQIGKVEIAVGLFSTVAKPSPLAEFDTAGPNGGVLKARAIARPVPVAEMVDAPVESVHSDPLADGAFEVRGPGVDIAEAVKEPEVAGEYDRELVEDGTGELVPPDQVRRGVRLDDGRFIDCTEQLAEIAERTKLDKMEVVPGGMVDITRIPRACVKGAYYIGAADEAAPRALRLIYEGLRQRRRGAVVKLTKKTRQSLGVIGWYGSVLVLYELVWSEDFRDPPARALAIQREELAAEELDAVLALIDAWSGSLDVVSELRDDSIELREQLRARALAGEVPQVLAAAALAEQDVLAQLEASLEAVS